MAKTAKRAKCTKSTKKAKKSRMEKYRQSNVLSIRDVAIGYCKGNHRYAVWEDDSNKKENTISVLKIIDEHLYFYYAHTPFSVRKEMRLKFLVTGEISERIEQKNVDVISLDEMFMEKCGKNHGLGPTVDSECIDELKEMAYNRFKALRSFYTAHPNSEKLRSLQPPFAANFIKSDYSVWADIELNGSRKCLCGTIDAIYWIDKSEKHVGIISWNTFEHFETPMEIQHEQSPFFPGSRTLLQRRQCQSHLHAAILEIKYGFIVTANIVNLKDDGFDIDRVTNWRACQCWNNSLFEIK